MINVSDAIKNREKQDFKADLVMAQQAEKALAIWLDNQNIYKKVQIVNQKGYDILCQKKDESFRKIEVKRDFWIDKYCSDNSNRKATDNICVEIWSNFACGNPGWIHYSDSNYIFYIGNENIYILDTVKLKNITDSIVDYGQANRVEPKLKPNVSDKVAKIQYTAHYNGNFKVRSVLIKKQWLINLGCLIRVIGREKSNFNKIASHYHI